MVWLLTCVGICFSSSHKQERFFCCYKTIKISFYELCKSHEFTHIQQGILHLTPHCHLDDYMASGTLLSFGVLHVFDDDTFSISNHALRLLL